jgi:hypothetical protein
MFPVLYATDIDVGGRTLPDPNAMRYLYRAQESHPAYRTALEAIRQDTQLAPIVGEDEGVGEFVRQNTGVGWRFMGGLEAPAAFVQSAARRAVAAGGSVEELQPIIDELPGVVAQVRRLLSGNVEKALALTAFHGLRLADGVSLDTPWGLLREATPIEQSQRPFGNPAPSVTLQAEIPLVWELGEAQDDAEGLRVSDELIVTAKHADLLSLSPDSWHSGQMRWHDGDGVRSWPRSNDPSRSAARLRCLYRL